MEIDLKGKRVLVTGGSGGIGSAIVKLYAAAGAEVCVAYYGDSAAADAIAGQIIEDGGRAFTAQANVADLAEVKVLFEQMDAELGGIDILVNCAGIDGKRELSWKIDPAEFAKVLNINLLGSFYCSQEALKRMLPSHSGVIINVSSVHEEIPWTGHVAYTAAKAGIAMMTQSMSQEVAEHGVRVLSLAPGAIRTPINQDVWDDPKQMKNLNTKIPMNRIGEPEEVAKIALVMASDWASYMTGSSVFVDGGMMNYPSFQKGG